jgi:hypothetical protein
MLTENLKTAYLLIYRQCSNTLRAKLELRPDHCLAIEGTADSLGLLENIRMVMFQFQSQRYSPLALHNAKRQFYLFSQDWHMMYQQYHKTFKNNVEVIEYCIGVVGKDTGLVDLELTLTGLTRANATGGQLQGAEDAAREWILACAFLLGSNHGCYGKLLEDLENNFTQGADNFPPTLQQAYTLLVHWKQDAWNVVCLMGGVNNDVAFTNVGAEGGPQDGGPPTGVDGVTEPTSVANSGGLGHITQECPHANNGGGKETTAMQLLMQGVEALPTEESFQFAQVDGHLPKLWVGAMVQSSRDCQHYLPG